MLKPLLEYYKARAQELLYKKQFGPIDEKLNEALRSVKSKGYYVWDNYYTTDECKQIRTEIDQLIEENLATIWRDDEDADNRIFFSERLSKSIKKFNTDQKIEAISKRYLNTSTSVLATLAGRIQFKGNNKGSGGGWHRDTNMVHQFKSIAYLSDVDVQNGSFEYLEGTHKKSTLFELTKHNIKLNQNRLSDTEVAKITADGLYKKIQFTAKAGTCLLVDTSGIHRGKPLEKGERYALTNYIYQDYLITNKLKNKFLRISPFRK